MTIFVATEWGESEWGIDQWGRSEYLSQKIRLWWEPSPSPDVDYYTVRYAPDADDEWSDGVEVYRTPSYLTTQTEELECFLDNATNGKYMVAATDTSGNEGPAKSVLYSDQNSGSSDWELRREFIGQPNWYGNKFEMQSTSDGFLLLQNRGGGLDTYPDGYIYGWFEHGNFTHTNPAQEPVKMRFVVDKLVVEGEEVSANYQWRLKSGATPITEWETFTDVVTLVDNYDHVWFRIEVRNYTLDKSAGVREAQVTAYIEPF